MARAPAELRRVADRAARALAAAGVPSPGDGIALAVSGGADSLALLHAMRALAGPRRWRLAVVTVDHGLRPGSAADAAFVADHAKALGLPVQVCTLTPADLARHRPAGPEGAARAARYEALWPAADALGCAYLATGHTMDDQAETVLLQLLRGAGPEGLAGMTVAAGRLLHPLLGVRRADTHACCAAIGVEPRQDPTNDEDGPLRNRVRRQLLPLLEDLRPGATQTLARTAALAADEREWLDPLVEVALAAVVAGVGVGEGAGRGGGAVGAGPVDSGDRPIPPSVTLPEGAPTTRGGGEARPGLGAALGGESGTPPSEARASLPDPAAAPREPIALDPGVLHGLPLALARRVVRAAARRAGLGVPDAAATDGILALADGADGALVAWPGGSATRAGTSIRLGSPPD